MYIAWRLNNARHTHPSMFNVNWCDAFTSFFFLVHICKCQYNTSSHLYRKTKQNKTKSIEKKIVETVYTHNAPPYWIEVWKTWCWQMAYVHSYKSSLIMFRCQYWFWSYRCPLTLPSQYVAFFNPFGNRFSIHTFNFLIINVYLNNRTQSFFSVVW